MSNDQYQEDQTRIFVTSGMQINDLGLYDSCLDNGNLTYATVIVRQKQDATSGDIRFTKREVKFGLCVPKQCDSQEKLQFLNNIYLQGLKISGVMKDPEVPLYGFPRSR